MTDLPNLASSIPIRLGISASMLGDELVMHHHPNPETSHGGVVRASVLTFVADAAAGIVVDDDPDAWAFTSDLSLRMRVLPAPERVDARMHVLRSGRRSVTGEVHMVDEQGRPFAYCAIGFARLPRRPGDPPKPTADLATMVAAWSLMTPIDEPLRDAVGIEVIDGPAGVVEVEIVDALRNPAGALQGAMVAFVAEIAAEELCTARAGRPMIVTDLDVRYLAQARVGPIRTRTEALGDGPDASVLVELIDTTTDRVVTHVIAGARPLPG